MTRIPEKDRHLLEQAIYLPMVMSLINRDLAIISQSSIKLKKPYITFLHSVLNKIHQDLYIIKKQMLQTKMKVTEINRDEVFTQFSFFYKGYEEQHNYFNPKIRSEVEQLMEQYFLKKENSPISEH